MDGSFELTLQITLAVLAGISAQVLGEYLKIPSIVFLLLLGICLGRDGLSILHPTELGIGLEVLVALAVAIILFEGGLNLELGDLGKVSGSIRNLVTIGTLITFLGGGMAAHWLAEFPWSIAFLYASLVVVTGPTVVGPLLKQVSVDRQVATLLEGEGVLIDPVGAILAVVVLDTIINSKGGLLEADALEIIVGLLLRLGIGIILGAFCGWLLGLIIKKAAFISDDLKTLVVLAGVWGIFCLAQTLQAESGLMATVVAGMVLRASSLPEERLIRRFKGQLTVLCVSVLFILLAADLSMASVLALGWGSVLTVIVLMFVVRPISVIICTWTSGMSWQQKFFVAWVAPRGIVSASVASLFAILLTNRGINGGEAIKALVFLTILMTVFIQGPTAGWLAQWLGITSSKATGALIIGCNPLSRLIGRLFQAQGESVVLIDTDPEACAKAIADNLTVHQSSGLDPEVLAEVGIESLGTFLALTNNSEVNLLLARHALEEFHPPRVLAVLPPNCSNSGTKKIQAAFLSQLSLKTWNQYLEEGQVKLGKTLIKEQGLELQQAHLQALIKAGELLPILWRRNQSLQIVNAHGEWQAGDEIIYLLHDPRPKLLKRLSGNKQAARLALEKLPEVEEVPI